MKKQYIFTERAHLMCPGMCFGIAGVLDAPCDKSLLVHALNAVTYAHPFLRAVIGCEKESDRYFYAVTDEGRVQLKVFDYELSGLEDTLVRDCFEQAVGKETDLFSEGMLRIFAWRMKEQTCVLFVFHHLLADGRGALGLVKEFADMYAGGKKPDTVEERLIQSVDDLPRGAHMSGMSRMLVNMFNKKWLKEGSHLSYDEYRGFADSYLKNHSVTHSVSVTEQGRLAELLEMCRQQGVTLNDYLLADMFEKQRVFKIIIAKDLRSQLECYQSGALGNYSSAFTVKLKKRGRSIWHMARAVHSEVRDRVADISALCLVLTLYALMEPGLIDASAAAALGGFDSKAAASAGKTLLGYEKPDGCCITNLGKLESKTLKEAMFIPPASPAMRLTKGILTVNGKMYTCTSERK
ncbi:MAG: hypothetical protein K6F27_03040 [Ruminococcus sp.]|nr:hypothetical protein [Ruminococcus sp.]